MALITVAADKRYFLDTKNNPFFALGVNYAGYFDRGWKMWEPNLFDPDLIARDFSKAQASGFNSIRLFVHPALEKDLRQNNFAKLDQTLSLAQDYELKVILTFNDSHSLNLSYVSEVDAKIAERYQDVATVMAYDLENEPVFYNLVAGIYPSGYEPPVQTSRLVDHYGARVSREEALELQRNRGIPSHLSADHAYFYINALRLFIEYDQAANTFINQGKGASIVDFMLSNEAEVWYTLIEVMDQTVDTWLRARIDPVRATGCQQLLTVGWNWMQFASLPANRILDFQAYHNYASLSLAGFNVNTAHLEGLRRAFPDHPVIFGEFGWSNQTSSNPAASQPVAESLTALYEAASHAYLRANQFGGAFKWKLNDLDITYNPYEANFGLFKVGDKPKPIRDIVQRFSQTWTPIEQPATFSAVNDLKAGMAYRFSLPQHVTVGGSGYQDEAISWRAEGEAAHCFIKTSGDELIVEAQGAGQLAIEPWEFIAGWNKARKTDLYRVLSETNRTRQHTFEAGERVVVDVSSGAMYAVVMGAAVPGPPSDGLPQIEPNPGEHVVLLGDPDHYLPAALPYIRHFEPDFTFAPDEVAGRWAYVSVVASPVQVADQVLDTMRSMGAVLVERVFNNSPEETKLLLDDLVAKSQRFLGTAQPPQEEPPTDPTPEPPPDDQPEVYVVQPGDTLSGIAKDVYGDYSLWPIIFEANRDKISNPSLIRVGMELLIPPRSE
ncbi:MAG TPA: LysM peptidoglycan-binding domain-containing protein [Anaerolineae bacterium]|mgnify:CR=1 FL=1|nr:LysM peptidoglycan-binding domain-containing protein [Anaerolineae bacterium]